MDTNPTPDPNLLDPVLYDKIIRYATVPALLLLLFLSWLILSRLMSPRWQQERRNQQIRKAVAERNARLADSAMHDENDDD